MKIKGKRNSIEVKCFIKAKCVINSLLTQQIWDKRKCFMCGSKFKNGDNPIVAITQKAPNKILCEKCFMGTGYSLIEVISYFDIKG
jgi:hypothetical protein